MPASSSKRAGSKDKSSKSSLPVNAGRQEDWPTSGAAYEAHMQLRSEQERKVKQAQAALRRYLRTRFGTDEKAFAALDVYRRGTITRVELESHFVRLRVPWEDITGVHDLQTVFPQKRAAADNGLDVYDFMDEGDEEIHREESAPREEHVDVEALTRNEHVLASSEEVTKFATWCAVGDHWDRFHELFQYEDKYSYVIGGVIGRRQVTLPEFLRHCRQFGFVGDGEGIFNLVRRECLTDRDKKNAEKFPEMHDGISLRQLKRFHSRIKTISQAEGAAETATKQKTPQQSQLALAGSPLESFRAKLFKRYGTLLHAWRTLDKKKLGRVSYVDFSNACRQLGYSSQLKLIWNAMRPNASINPADFHELAPDESANLEKFAECIWRVSGFNMEAAWSALDENRANQIDEKTFIEACSRIQFDGDISLLFKGLSEPGLGKLFPADLDYVKKVARLGRERLRSSTSLMHDLVAWVQGNFGSAEDFIKTLGLDGHNREMTVTDLAARLMMLGYNKDAIAVSSRIARDDGGTFVTVDSLYSLLKGGLRRGVSPAAWHKGYMDHLATSPSKALASPDFGSPSSSRGVKPPWNGRLDRISESNDERHRNNRRCFVKNAKDEEVFVPAPRRAASAGALTTRYCPNSAIEKTSERVAKEDETIKPGWDARVYYICEHNMEKPKHLRQAFSNHYEQPVKEEQAMKLKSGPTRRVDDELWPRGPRMLENERD